jgi:ribosomal protein L37AE/L43A
MGGMDQVERLASHIDEGLLEVAQEIRLLGSTAHPLLQAAIACWKPGFGARNVDATALHRAVRELQFNVPAPVLHWYKRYRQLSLWRDNLRGKIMKRRREQYRLVAREITTSNCIIGIEDMDIAAMAKVKKSDTGDNELHAAARAQRVRADVSLLRQEIIHQAKKNGCEVIIATKDTTARCHSCGKVTKQGDKAKVMWRCEHCGTLWDQDINATTNLMTIASGAASGQVVTVNQDAESVA